MVCEVKKLVKGCTRHTYTLQSRADFSALLPGTCQVGRLVRRPGGPHVNVEVGQTTYPVNRNRLMMEGMDCHREGGSGTGEGARDSSLRREGSIWIFAPELIPVTPLLMGPV